MSIPTSGELFSKLTENIRHAQENSAMLGHITRAQSSSSKDNALADGWIAVSELMKRLNHQVIELAKGKLQ